MFNQPDSGSLVVLGFELKTFWSVPTELAAIIFRWTECVVYSCCYLKLSTGTHLNIWLPRLKKSRMTPCPSWRSLGILGSYSWVIKAKTMKLTWIGPVVTMLQTLYWPVVLKNLRPQVLDKDTPMVTHGHKLFHILSPVQGQDMRFLTELPGLPPIIVWEAGLTPIMVWVIIQL